MSSPKTPKTPKAAAVVVVGVGPVLFFPLANVMGTEGYTPNANLPQEVRPY